MDPEETGKSPRLQPVPFCTWCTKRNINVHHLSWAPEEKNIQILDFSSIWSKRSWNINKAKIRQVSTHKGLVAWSLKTERTEERKEREKWGNLCLLPLYCNSGRRLRIIKFAIKEDLFWMIFFVSTFYPKFFFQTKIYLKIDPRLAFRPTTYTLLCIQWQANLCERQCSHLHLLLLQFRGLFFLVLMQS